MGIVPLIGGSVPAGLVIARLKKLQSEDESRINRLDIV